jgi:hypothetical protein
MLVRAIRDLRFARASAETDAPRGWGNRAGDSGSPAEQRTRFAIRLVDPVRHWKFSPMDIESVTKWDDYTAAKEEMFKATDTDIAPWIVVRSNDNKRARINAMRYLLAKSDYDDKDPEVVGEPDPLIVGARWPTELCGSGVPSG